VLASGLTASAAAQVVGTTANVLPRKPDAR
jgi:hypothetical protein